MLNIFYKVEKGPQMQVKQFWSVQGRDCMRRQLLQKCWNENYKCILGKFLAIHFNLIILLDFLKLKIFSLEVTVVTQVELEI